MRKILQNFDAVEKKTLTEAYVVECPPDMPTMETGGELSINITGDAGSMSQILRALAGIQGGRMSMGTSMHDDPDIPGRDDVEGDTDLNQGVLGALTGAGLGGAAGLALGGPMGGLTGALAGAGAGDQLTDKDVDDPSIPGRDDVEGDTDLQADIASLAGAAGDAISNFAGQALQKGGEIGANLGSRAAQAAANTDVGMSAMRRLAGVSDIVPDAIVGMGAGARGADIGSKIGKGAVAVGAPAAAIGGMAAMGNNKGDKEVEEWDNEPEEKYSDHDMMLNKLSGGINGKKQMYKPAAKGDNPMAVEEEGRLSPDFLKALDLKFGSKPSLSPKTEINLRKEMVKLGPKEVMQLAKANIPHVSDAAQHELNNRRARGLKGHDESMAMEMKARLEKALAEKKNAKPDFLDMDKDGDKKEPMKKAVADKKAKGPVKETSQELDDMVKFLQRLI